MSFKEYVAENTVDEGGEVKTRVFRVPVENLPLLQKKIADLNKKAAKLGTKPSVISLGEVKSERVQSEHPSDYPKYREFQYLTVAGEIPILAGGWAFVGKLEPHPAGTIVKSAPGRKLPTKYQFANPMHCEHCGVQRRRNETFVVKKGRKHIQVGRSCLKDFLGHADPEKYAAYAENMFDLESTCSEYEDERMGGSRIVPHLGTEAVLTVAHAYVRLHGFISRQNAGERVPTSGLVIDEFFPPRDIKGWKPIPTIGADGADAKATIAWVKEKAKTDNSEFWQNLNKMVSVETNKLNAVGYLTAAAAMYRKETENKVAQQKTADGIKDEPIGKEGDKVKLVAEVLSAFTYSRQSYSYYDSGVSQILTMKDSEGHIIKMFTANLDIKKGDIVTISGRLGKAEPEKFEKSPFKGKIVTMMAPRSRVAVKE